VPNGPAPYCSTATMRVPARGAPVAPDAGSGSVTRIRLGSRAGPRCSGPRSPSRAGSRTGSVGQVEPAVPQERGQVAERPEERVALLVEALHVRVVGHRCQQVRRHLGLLVMAQLDAVRRTYAGGLAPDGRAACPRGVEVGDVDGPVRDQVAQPVEGHLALAGGDRDARLEPHVAHPATVIGPATGLLEPAQVEVRDEPAELDRLGSLIPLVGVDHDGEVRASGFSRHAHALRVLAGRATPDLELHAREPLGIPRDELARLVEVEVVVAADDGHGQRIGDRAPQPVGRQPDRLREHVPDGRVDARDGLERQATVAQDVVGRGLHRSPRTLRVRGAATQDPWRELVVDDAHDEQELIVSVAVVDLGHQPIRGVQARDDGRAVDHRVCRAHEPPRQRGAERDGLDTLDAQRAPIEHGRLGGREARGRRAAGLDGTGRGHRPTAVRAAAAMRAADGIISSSRVGL